MGEVREWWSELRIGTKVRIGVTGALFAGLCGLQLYRDRKNIYDPEKQEKEKKVSKWD